MLKLVRILLLCCVGDIMSVKDVPKIKAKVSDAITRKKNMLLDKQAARRKLRAEKIDELLDDVIEYYSNSPPAYEFGYIGAYDCYKKVIDPYCNGCGDKNFKGIFDFEDLVEILDMLTKKKILTQPAANFLQRIGWYDRNYRSGPYFQLSKNLK